MSLNRLLTDEDRNAYAPLIESMFEACPDMMSRKIRDANVQQAFVLQTVMDELSVKPKASILCVGSFEDTAAEFLIKEGHYVACVDPQINMDLHTFYSVRDNHGSSFPEHYSIIFSTSVIEHVEDDEEFLADICNLLEHGGIGIITCDYNNNYTPGDRLPYSDLRFYTESDLKFRLGKVMQKNDCELIDCPDWSGNPDFSHDGCDYSFATYVFRKKERW